MPNSVRAWVLAHRRLARTVGRRPRRQKKAPVRWPQAVELAYLAKLRAMLAPVHRAVADRVYPPVRAHLEAQRQDTAQDDVRKAMGAIRLSLTSAFSDQEAEAIAEDIASRTSAFQREQLQAQMRKLLGVDVPIRDGDLRQKVDAFTAENVGLIQSIPRAYLDQVQNEVLRAMSTGERWEELATRLERRFEVTESRAALIARDQVGKFFSSVNTARQKALGLTHFFWATDHDERVCPVCGPLDGKRFAYADPPSEGMPGHVHPNCRCNADPDVSGFLDDLEKPEEEKKPEPSQAPERKPLDKEAWRTLEQAGVKPWGPNPFEAEARAAPELGDRVVEMLHVFRERHALDLEPTAGFARATTKEIAESMEITPAAALRLLQKAAQEKLVTRLGREGAGGAADAVQRGAGFQTWDLSNAKKLPPRPPKK